MASENDMDFTLTNEHVEAINANINTTQPGNLTNNNSPLNAELLNLEKRGFSILPQQQQGTQHSTLKSANGTANGTSNILSNQKRAPFENKTNNNSKESLATSSSGITVKETGIERRHNNSAKRPRFVNNKDNNINANATQLSPLLSNNRFAMLDLDVHTVLTNTSVTTDNTCKDTSTTDDNKIDKSATEDGTETQSTAADIEESTQRQHFLPPIVMFDVNIRAFVLELKSKVPNLIFKIKNCTNRKSKLFVKDYSAYSRIMTILKEKKINSHSYTPAQDKQISLILRGIHYSTSIDEIKNELDVLVPNTVDSVHIFLTAHMKRNNSKSNLFRLNLKPGCDSKEITSIKYILSQSISWEKPKTFNKQLQCKRCQRWGHIAKNCNHPYHCVKCNSAHGPGERSLKKSKDSKPYCINCKEWGHPANFRGCEAYKAFADNRSKKNNTPSNPSARPNNLISNLTSTPNSIYVKPNVTYASHFKAPSRFINNNFQNAKLLEDFMQLAKQLLEEEEPIPLETQIENFIKNFRSMPLETRKAECRKLLRQLK